MIRRSNVYHRCNWVTWLTLPDFAGICPSCPLPKATCSSTTLLRSVRHERVVKISENKGGKTRAGLAHSNFQPLEEKKDPRPAAAKTTGMHAVHRRNEIVPWSLSCGQPQHRIRQPSSSTVIMHLATFLCVDLFG